MATLVKRTTITEEYAADDEIGGLDEELDDDEDDSDEEDGDEEDGDEEDGDAEEQAAPSRRGKKR